MRLVAIGQSVENYPTIQCKIIVNFKIEGMCIRQSLPDSILRILLSRFLVSFTNWLAYSEMKMKSILCLKLLRKPLKHMWSVRTFDSIKTSNFFICFDPSHLLSYQPRVTYYSVYNCYVKINLYTPLDLM